jgi:hypothetical protein
LIELHRVLACNNEFVSEGLGVWVSLNFVVWPETFSRAALQILFLIGCETINIPQI